MRMDNHRQPEPAKEHQQPAASERTSNSSTDTGVSSDAASENHQDAHHTAVAASIASQKTKKKAVDGQNNGNNALTDHHRAHNGAMGHGGRGLPADLAMAERNSSFFETKLDIKREMEERNKREFDVWGKETYLNATKQSNLIPMTIALRQLATEELNLSHRVLDSQDLRPLCLSLHTNANISVLKLDDNDIGIDGAKFLLTALKENVAVRELSLADNHLGNAVCALVAELLATNRNLLSINLSGNNLDDRAGRDVGAILEVTFTLKALNLARNKLSDAAADEISNSLRYNDSIESLSLEWNNFHPFGCKMLFNGLKRNLGCRHFAFKANGTDDGCIQAIVEMLQSNHVLTSLDLSNSRLTDRSTAALIGQGLARNDALEQLNLDGNLFSEISLLQFLDFIRTSSTAPPLKKVFMQTVPIKAKTAEMLSELKQEHPEAAVIVAGPVAVGIPGRKPGQITPRPSENNTNNPTATTSPTTNMPQDASSFSLLDERSSSTNLERGSSSKPEHHTHQTPQLAT